MFKQFFDRAIPCPEEGVRFFRDLNISDAIEQIPQGIRTVITEKAERWLAYCFPVIPLSWFMEYKRFGGRYSHELLLVDRWEAIFDLTCAELIHRDGRYIDKLMDCLWMCFEMSTWTVQAHDSYIVPTVDGETKDNLELFSAEMSSVVAWAYYFFKDEFEKRAGSVFNQRIVYELRWRMLDNFMENAEKRFWYKNGSGNWNIWIMSNLLAVAGIVLTDQKELTALVHKVLDSVQNYIDDFPKDGICAEGPRYWYLSCGAFIDTLELLYDMTGVDLTGEPIVQKMLSYTFYMMLPGNRMFNFGDAETNLCADPLFIRRMAIRIGDTDIENWAAGLYVNDQKSYHKYASNYYRQLRNLFCSNIIRRPYTPYEPPFPAYLESISTFFGKEGDMKYALKAASNGEPHGHPDTGSMILYKGDKPILVDPGMDCYSSYGWSPSKHKHRNPAWHNTILFNGYAEKLGREAAATDKVYSPDDSRFSCQLAGTFAPEAEVKSWNRACYNRDGVVCLEDTWEIGGKGDVSLVLMVQDDPKICPEEHTILLEKTGTRIVYDSIFTPVVDMLDRNGALDCPEYMKEFSLRKDFYQVAPRLPYEMPCPTPYPCELQWGQPYLYRIQLQATNANCGHCVTEICG